jgi:hypothetical protein
MRRREFLALLGIGVGSLPTFAQSPTLPRIGLLLANEGPARDTIIRSLEARGYVHRRTVLIEERQARGQLERLPALAQELVSIPVDVIIAFAASGTIAARQATSTIPIVMVLPSSWFMLVIQSVTGSSRALPDQGVMLPVPPHTRLKSSERLLPCSGNLYPALRVLQRSSYHRTLGRD